ncbi:hypothetical protein P3444_23515, partial [Vibrio parahaemolyticus]|nr:hypothetical protein [Vibrio parahaemolyticus]
VQGGTVISPVKFGQNWTMYAGVINYFLFSEDTPNFDAIPRSHTLMKTEAFDNFSSSRSWDGTDQGLKSIG